MGDEKLPEWLAAARFRERARRPLEISDDWPRLPRVGDLRIADPTVAGRSDPRMVLVIGLDPEIGVADVTLVSNETEFASGSDVVVAAGTSGLPFDVVVESGVVARIWCVQLGRLVAELGSEAVRDARRCAMAEWTKTADSPRVQEGEAGLDQRSLFRQRERRELGALSEDCRETLGRRGTGPETVIDPVLLDSPAGGSQGRRIERWLAAAEILIRSKNVTVPVAALSSSLETCGFGHRPWGPDELRAVLPLLERALAERRPGYDERVEVEPGRSRPAEGMDRELMSMLSTASRCGRRTVRLLTLPEAWTGEFCESMAMARAVMADGTEMQIIRHNLEVGS
jgi:hypothetical protein